MSTRTRPASGAVALAEMKEFASFAKGTQRYIRRSLDIGLDRRDAVKRWSRDTGEAASIRAQRDQADIEQPEGDDRFEGDAEVR